MQKIALLFITALLFEGCSNNSIELKKPEILDSTNYQAKENRAENIKKLKASKIKTSIKKNPIKKPKVKKPVELERVCFDKKGIAHNCNYKIKKPYLQEQSLYN